MRTEEIDRAHAEHTDQFRLLVESVRDYAIFLLDSEGYVRSWNAGAQRIKGYSADEIIGRHFSTFYSEAEAKSGKPAEELRIAAADGRWEEEGWRIRKDGSRFWANVVITALREPSGELVGFAKVTRDLTERKRAEENRLALAVEHARLAEAARRAEEAVAIRDEFVRIAAHELRTPITSAMMGVQLLKRSVGDMPLSSRQALALDTLEIQMRKLVHLISRLLDKGRMEAGALRLERAEVDLVTLVRRACEQWQVVANKHEIVMTTSPAELFANVDGLRIDEVLSNLIDNAVKYSPAGGRIEVGVSADQTHASITVRDHGIGVDPEKRPRIFERFFQAHPDRSGMGLGLYLCRQFVEMHGGTISADFPEDGGTCFVVTLPLA